jgi:hypothetical protein
MRSFDRCEGNQWHFECSPSNHSPLLPMAGHPAPAWGQRPPEAAYPDEVCGTGTGKA